MRSFPFLLFLFLMLLMPAKAEIIMDLSANFQEPIALPNETTQLLVNLTLGSNETGSNLLVIDIVYDAGSGWGYSSYSASMNGNEITFNVSENDVNVSGVLKHRITFSTNLTPPSLNQPEQLALNVKMRTPDVENSSYLMDVIAMWSFPASNATKIKSMSLNAVVSKPDLYPVSLTFSSENPVEGESVTISAKIRNSGGRAGNVNVSLKVDGSVVRTLTASFEANSEQTLSFTWQAIKGKHTIEVEIDPENAVDELNETNNRIGKQINVREKAVTAPPPRRGGGGGGGGAIFIPPPLQAESEFSYSIAELVQANAEKRMEMPSSIKDKMGVTAIAVKVPERMTLSTAISKVKELPANISEFENAYVYFEIVFTKYGTSEKVEPSGYIEFRVPKDWIESNGLDPEKVVLMKYGEGWKELRTEKVSEDDEYYYYRAEVESFSIFAITAKPKPVIIPTPTPTATAMPTATLAPTLTPTITPTVTPTPRPLQPTAVIGIAVAVIVAIAIVAYLARRR